MKTVARVCADKFRCFPCTSHTVTTTEGMYGLAGDTWDRTVSWSRSALLLLTLLLSAFARPGLSYAAASPVKLVSATPSGDELTEAKSALENGSIVAMQNVPAQTFGVLFNAPLAVSHKASDLGGSFCVVAAAYDRKHLLHTYRGGLVRPGSPADPACMTRFRTWANQLKTLQPNVQAGIQAADAVGDPDPGPPAGAWTPLIVNTESDTDSSSNELQVTYSIYRANSNFPDNDWYAVVQQTGSQPAYQQCKAPFGYDCGWLNSDRNLTISATSLSGTSYAIFDHAPLQVNNSTTTQLTAGVNVSNTGGGVSAAYNFSYSQSNVTTTDTTQLATGVASWSDSFAGKGSWAHDSDPPAALQALWQSYQTAIFSVPVGTSSFQINIDDKATFSYINDATSTIHSDTEVAETILVYAPTLAASPGALILAPGQAGTLRIDAQIAGSNAGVLGWKLTSDSQTNIDIAPPNGAGQKQVSITVPGGTSLGVISLSLDTADQFASTQTRTGPITIPVQVVAPSSIQPGVLMTGGQDWSANPLKSAEIWNPATKTSRSVGSMQYPRYGHTATAVVGNQVLVAGGLTDSVNSIPQTELYDEVTQTFSSGPNMQSARAWHSATLLNDGTVLIAGGDVGGGAATNTAEIYNPVANTTTSVGAMTSARMLHTATLLNTGNVLLCGGYTALTEGLPLTSCDIYFPDQKSFQGVDTSSVAQYDFNAHAAAADSDGYVVLVGDSNVPGSGYDLMFSPAQNILFPQGLFASNGLASAMVSLPGNQLMLVGGESTPDASLLWTFQGNTASAGMSEQRVNLQALLLQNTNTPLDGSVVALGGVVFNTGSTSGTGVEVNNPVTNTWSPAGNLTTPRSGTTATLVLAPVTPAFTLTSSASPAIVGTNVVFTATLAATNIDPTGVVAFAIDGSTTPVTAALLNGVATYSTSSLSLGTHSITATYNGGAGLQQANASLTQVISPNPVTSNISGQSLPQPVPYGTPTVSLQGAVSGQGSNGTIFPAPGEQVTINIGAATYSTPLKSDGTFKYDFPLNAAAIPLDASTTPYPISYSYAGDAQLKRVQVQYGSLTIQPLTSQFGKITGPTPPVYTGTQSISSSGSIASSAAGYYPTGNVTATIYQGTSPIASASGPIGTNGAISVSVPVTNLAAGAYTLSYSYAGTADYTAVTSASVPFTAISVSTTTTLGATTLTPLVGQNEVFTANVQASSGFATGTVTFMDGSVALGTNSLQGGAQTSFSTSALAAGPHTIIAVYNPNAPYQSSTATLSISVILNAATISNVTSQSVQAGTSLINVSGNVGPPNGGPVATGSMKVTIDGQTSASVNLDGQGGFFGTLDISSIPASATQYAITCHYSGDSNYAATTDASQTLTVNKDASQFVNLSDSQTVTVGTQQAVFSGKVLTESGPTDFTATTTTPSTAGIVGVYFENWNADGVSTDNATFSVWIKTDTKNLQMILQEPGVDPAIYLQNDQIGVAWEDSSGNIPTWVSTDTTPVSDGLWHHIAVSFNQGKITFYKDGIATSDNLSVGSLSVSTTAVNFGGGAWNGIPSFVGQMWNAQVWADAKTSADIQTDMYLTQPNGDPALRVLSSFVASNRAIDLINNQAARVNLVSTISSPIPFSGQYPSTSEQLQLTVKDLSGNQVATQSAAFGPNGTFSASVPIGTFKGGTYEVDYSYTGNAVLLPSTASSSLTIGKAASTTTVTASGQNPSAWGVPVTFTANVTGIGGKPTGTVTFQQGGNVVQIALTNGSATYAPSALPPEANTITATYSGDSTFAGSSGAVTLNVIKATPAMDFSSSPNPSVQGQSVVLTARLTGMGGTPSGTVTFSDGGNPLQTIKLVNGTAIYSSSTLATGSHNFTALYGGDTFFGTLSATTSQTVKLLPSITLTSLQNPSALGQPVTLSATIISSSGTPTGTVTFSSTSGTLGTIPLAGGKASYSTLTLPVGPTVITATYSGDSNFASNTATVTQTVNGVTLTASPNPAILRQIIVLIAKVPQAGPVPTGSVTFFEVAGQNTYNYGSAKVDSTGTASLTIDPTNENQQLYLETIGSHNLYAAYGGDSNYAASKSPFYSIVVTGVGATPPPNQFSFANGFASAGQTISLNGNAKLDGSRLQLTDGGLNEAGSTFYATSVNIQNFTSDFAFQLNQASADGFTFAIQNSGVTALGYSGGSLGYFGIGKSVAIKFDLYDNQGEGSDSTGLYIDGESATVPAIDLMKKGIDLHSGHPFSAHLTYDGQKLKMRLTDTVTKVAWSHDFRVDIPTVVGSTTAYVGFTGATGGETADQQLISWSFAH